MAQVVRIYRPAKTAMQSGRGNTRKWLIEFLAADAKRNDTLMGWSGSRDTQTQVKLRFDTREEAVAYAQRQGWVIQVEQPQERVIRPKSYADNFAYNRIL